VQRAETAQIASQPAQARRGRCIAVVGARGGVGASTVAGNLAWLVASERDRQTGLLDLDLQYGCQALALDLQPAGGLREALEDPERVDDSMIDNLGVKAGERLTVFAAEEAVDDVPVMPRTAATQLLAKLRETRDVLVADLPRHLLGQQPDLLDQVTDLVIVTDLSLAGLRDCNRLVRLAKQQGGKMRVRVVANRVGKQAPGHVGVQEFAKELETELAGQLSFDPENIAKAAMAGRTLSDGAPKAKLLADLQVLLVDLVGEPRKPKRSLLSFLKKG
jgi:pilus assembly protein CpaE